MRTEAIRPLTETELSERSKFDVCRCSQPITHRAKRVKLQFTSLRYRQASGLRDGYTREELRLCSKCAASFCNKHSLPFVSAPIPDPAVGQHWRHWSTEQVVEITELRNSELTGQPEVGFAPALETYGIRITHTLLVGFLIDFDPET